MTFPDRDSGAIEAFLQVVDRVRAVMKDGCRERRVGLAVGENAGEMLGLPGPTRCDHRDASRGPEAYPGVVGQKWRLDMH